MQHNKLAESGIVGEMEDKFLVKNGNKISPLPKAAVESWAMSHGFIENMGYDALPAHEKAKFQGNRQRNTMHVKEREARLASTKDENLQAYHNQKKDTRLDNAMHKDRMNNMQGADGPIEGVHYKGGMKYKGKGTISR